MQLSLKPKTFCDSFNPFLESTSNFKDFEKKIIVIATLLRNLQAVKNLVNLLSKKNTVSEHRFKVNMLKSPKFL